jgi:hypothetical protein
LFKFSRKSFNIIKLILNDSNEYLNLTKNVKGTINA